MSKLYEYSPRTKKEKEEHSMQIRHRLVLAMRSIIEQHPEVRNRKLFAESLFTGQSSISRWEAGTGYPTLENCVDACLVYGLSPHYLFLGQGTPFGEAEMMVRLEMLEGRVKALEKYLNIKVKVPKGKQGKLYKIKQGLDAQ